MENKCITLPEFMEEKFGEIKTIRKFNKVKPLQDGLYVASFDAPFEGVRTYATLGLSKIDLEYKKEGENVYIREEFIFGVNYDIGDDELPYQVLLSSIIEAFFENRKIALKQGDIINIGTSLIDKTKMCAIYITYPVVYTNEDFITYTCSDPNTDIMWMIPIYNSEKIFIEKNGWIRFEELLEEKNPDLFAIQREPVV